MQIQRTQNCPEIVANDGCRLRELLNPRVDGSSTSYSIAVAWVDPGKSTFPHCLKEETEVYYIIRGNGRMHINDEIENVEAGDAVVIPSGARQWIECTGQDSLKFLALVNPPWQPDHDIRLDNPGNDIQKN